MKEIYSHPDYTRVGYFESVLKEAGIRCFIQNATTHNLLTGIPSHLFYPKLCIIDDEDLDTALELLLPLQEKAIPHGGSHSDWVCPHCGETVPAGFEQCWKCDALRHQPA
ncbi:MAG TPA: DUF2007 domain-containing protein [Verrucomicrobiaceae bacterium]|jgi:hypothetical protein